MLRVRIRIANLRVVSCFLPWSVIRLARHGTIERAPNPYKSLECTSAVGRGGGSKGCRRAVPPWRSDVGLVPGPRAAH